MKKKTTEVSVSTSSGAEKVERIENEGGMSATKRVKSTAKKTPSEGKTEKTAVGESAMGNPSHEISDGKAERESLRAKARVEAAIAKKEAQEKRKEERKSRAAKKVEARKKKAAEKKAAIEKRAAEKKAKAAKHAAERKALAEKRKAEKEAKIRERAHAKANRNNENYKRKKEKSTRRKESHREGQKGYGGWIAAVVSLGVVSLALATTVTVGAVEMRKSEDAQMGAYKGTMYELTGLMENVDKDLDRIRISNSATQQSRILTDLLVQTRLAELDLEKMPISAETDRNVTSFINRTAMECERMLGKLRRGESLTKRDKESLEGLYETNRSVREEMRSFLASMTDKDLSEFVKKGEGKMKESLEKLEKSTILENKVGATREMPPAWEMPPAEIEKKDKPHIEAATAEQLCGQYFADYHVADFQCIGETATRGYQAYNVQGYDDRGNQLFAEISQADGTLLRFDYYEDCADEKVDTRSAKLIAEEFLEMLGYEDMETVRLRTNGSNVDFTFVYEDDDVAFYPDEIRVKVCRSRGVVSGFDCTKYLRNHKERDGEEVPVKLTLAEAYEKLYEGLQVASSRLAVIQTERGERGAYEFLCSYGEERYFVYLDAVSGEEIAIVNAQTIG